MKITKASLLEKIEVATNPKYRIAWTPFGPDTKGTEYGGKAVPWKGMKKAPGESTDAYLRRLREALPETAKRVADGLAQAISISQASEGIKGTALVQYKDGVLGVMPTKAAEQSLRENGVVASIVSESLKIHKNLPAYRRLLLATA